MRGGNDYSSSISRRTRSRTDVYYKKLHDELKKSRVQAASGSGIREVDSVSGTSTVASDVKVNSDGNGQTQDSVVDSSKTVSSEEVVVLSGDDDSDCSADRSDGDSGINGSSEEDSDDNFDCDEILDEYTVSSNSKRARKTFEVQGSVQKESATEIYQLISDDEEEYMLRRNNTKRNTVGKGEKRKPGKPRRAKNIIIDNEDNDEEFALNKQGRPSNKKASGRSKKAVIEQLVDSIWKQKDLIDTVPLLVNKKASYQSTLPLKFRLEDNKPSTPEKTEWEKEIDSLKREMEIALWQPEDSSMADGEDSCSGNTNRSTCCDREDVTLDEQIGLICNFCSNVLVHIRDILPSMYVERHESKVSKELPASPRDEFSFKPPASGNNTVEPCVSSEETVFDLIPASEKERLFQHQLEGFEFIWKNVAGDTHIKNLINLSADQGGGCIISHDPGTGKTRLSIVFLQTFLKLYPDCHPVIIAPRGMLMTWEQEFKKWNVGINFLNLNESQLNTLEAEAAESVVGHNRVHEKDIDYIRFAKLHAWMKGGSILGVSYNLFFRLAGEHKEKSSYEKFRKILLEVPGLLFLDEGHTARNNQSRTWKALKLVKTQRRVLLSGTLFQNNFDELYNTLSLVNPRFVLVKKKPGRKRKHDGWEISKSTAEKEQVMKLQSIMKPFVHVHKGDVLQNTLPGLKENVILLRPTDLQKELLRCTTHQVGAKYLDRDYLANLVSIHPWLAASDSSTKKIPDFLIYKQKLLKMKLNVNEGVKARFLIELIKLATSLGEKVLVFSQYIRPLDYVKELLKFQFSWNEGQEFLSMNGVDSQKQRQFCIDSFNDKTSKAKVLLASQRACSEGISLVGASRVVLLDVVWNPSVTRQAISRAYRIGQERVVHVYHLVTFMEQRTSEMKKFVRQAEKERISELIFSPGKSSGDSRNNVIEEDKVLEVMVTHENLSSIFEMIVHQPKETNFRDTFGSLDISLF